MAEPATASAAPQSIRTRGFTLFRDAGIQIRIDPSWFLIFLLIAWSLAVGYFPRGVPDQHPIGYAIAGVLAALLFFASLLLHELAHSLVARAYGFSVPTITLFLFGGASHMAREPDRPGQEFWIAVVGPLASFAVGALFLVLSGIVTTPLILARGIAYLGWINIALGVFNLLPGMPLDGGRILRAAVWRWTGSRRRASHVASLAGQGLAIGLVALGALQIFEGALLGGIWLILIGLFARSLAQASHQGTMLRHSLEGVSVADAMVRDVVRVSPDLPVARFVDDYVVGHGHRAFPVVDGERVQGIVSVESVRRIPVHRRGEARISECMDPIADSGRADPEMPLLDALQTMEQSGAQRLLVFDARGHLAGLLTRAAVARFLEMRRLLGHEARG
jgi:Zn-dependent protease/CBS domain-containing protein